MTLYQIGQEISMSGHSSIKLEWLEIPSGSLSDPTPKLIILAFQGFPGKSESNFYLGGKQQ